MSERRRFFWTCRLHTNTPPSHSGGFCRRPALSWHLWRRLHCFGSRSRLRCFRCRRCLRSWLSRRCLPEKQPGAQPYTVRFENGILMRHSTLPRFRANGLWSKDFPTSLQLSGLRPTGKREPDAARSLAMPPWSPSRSFTNTNNDKPAMLEGSEDIRSDELWTFSSSRAPWCAKKIEQVVKRTCQFSSSVRTAQFTRAGRVGS